MYPMDVDIDEQPMVVDGRVVSVWRHVLTMPEPKPAGGELGALLRGLHSQPEPTVRLRRFANPLYTVAAAINQIIGAMNVSMTVAKNAPMKDDDIEAVIASPMVGSKP